MSTPIVRPGDLVLDRVRPGDLIKSDLINAIIQNIEALNTALAGVGGAGLVSVPNLVGRTFADARTIINTPTTHLVMGSVFDVVGQNISPLAADAQTRRVVSQSPSAGVGVATGTAVSLVLSAQPGTGGGGTPPRTVIDSFSPESTRIGEVVTINGNNFSLTREQNEVFFAGVKADIPVTATARSIGVRIPDIPIPASGLVSVLVRTPNGDATGQTAVLPRAAVPKPSVTGLSTASVEQGSSLTINGTGFATAFDGNTVIFESGGLSREVAPRSGTASSLTVVIPDNFATAFNVTPQNSPRSLHVRVRNNTTKLTSDLDDSRRVNFSVGAPI
jgi:hypothetical protein